MKVQKETWLTLVIQFRLYDFWVTVGLEGVTISVTLFDWVTFWTIWYVEQMSWSVTVSLITVTSNLIEQVF